MGSQRAKKKKKKIGRGVVWLELVGPDPNRPKQAAQSKSTYVGKYLDLELDFLGHSANSRTFELWKGRRNRRHISEFGALSTILAWSDRPPHREQLRVKAFIRTDLPIENSHRHCCLRHSVDPLAGHTTHHHAPSQPGDETHVYAVR